MVHVHSIIGVHGKLIYQTFDQWKIISVYTYIFQCKQCNHSKVNPDTQKLTCNVAVVNEKKLSK